MREASVAWVFVMNVRVSLKPCPDSESFPALHERGAIDGRSFLV